MPIRVLIVTGTPYGSAARTVAVQDHRQPVALVGQRRSPALAGHLGHRAAEVEVDVPDRVLGDQDPGRLGHDHRVHAVELDRADPLAGVELQHGQGLGVPLDQPARGDHLADVEPGALLPAELPVRRVGDPGHRRQHHRGRHLDRTRGAAPAWRQATEDTADSAYVAPAPDLSEAQRARTSHATRTRQGASHQRADDQGTRSTSGGGVLDSQSSHVGASCQSSARYGSLRSDSRRDVSSRAGGTTGSR